MPPFQLALYFTGPFAGVVTLWRMTFLTPTITFSNATWIAASLGVATNGSLVIGIYKNSVQLATMTWISAGTIPTISVIGTTTFLANDKLDIARVSGTDTVGARLSVTLLGARS